MKKILFLIQLPPPVHGVSQINEQVFKLGIFDTDIQKSLIQLKFSDKLNELQKFNLKKVFRFCKIIFQLTNRLYKDPPDFIYFSIMPHGIGFIRDLFFVVIIKTFRVPIIYHLHLYGISSAVEKRPYLKYIYRYVFNKNYIIHLSQHLADEEILSLGCKPSGMYIVPNGVESRYLNYIEKKDKKIFNLLFVSNVNKDKGIFELLDTAKILKSRGMNFILDIVGGFISKRIENKVKQMIQHDNLSKHVFLQGAMYDENKYEFYKNADLFVLPTHNDTMPLAILEAMQFELPVVTTKVGALQEIIKNEEDGFLLEPGNPYVLADKISGLQQNKELRLKIGRNARKRFLAQFTREIFENNIKKVFDQIIFDSSRR